MWFLPPPTALPASPAAVPESPTVDPPSALLDGRLPTSQFHVTAVCVRREVGSRDTVECLPHPNDVSSLFVSACHCQLMPYVLRRPESRHLKSVPAMA